MNINYRNRRTVNRVDDISLEMCFDYTIEINPGPSSTANDELLVTIIRILDEHPYSTSEIIRKKIEFKHGSSLSYYFHNITTSVWCEYLTTSV